MHNIIVDSNFVTRYDCYSTITIVLYVICTLWTLSYYYYYILYIMLYYYSCNT